LFFPPWAVFPGTACFWHPTSFFFHPPAFLLPPHKLCAVPFGPHDWANAAFFSPPVLSVLSPARLFRVLVFRSGSASRVHSFQSLCDPIRSLVPLNVLGPPLLRSVSSWLLILNLASRRMFEASFFPLTTRDFFFHPMLRFPIWKQSSLTGFAPAECFFLSLFFPASPLFQFLI